MTRTVSAVTTAAVGQDTTTPIYLVRMGWDTERRICTWDVDITWNSETWTAEGATVQNLSSKAGTLILPNGDGDPWLALVNSEVPLDRTIEIYEHHTSTDSPAGSDATLVFSGTMDKSRIAGLKITISLVEGRTKKGFPTTTIGPPTHTNLLPSGTKLYWNADVITVQ